MQMALPSALRNVLLCFLAQAFVAPGFSVHHLRSQIPDDRRVTTVAAITAGLPPQRPAPPAPEAAAERRAAVAAPPGAASGSSASSSSSSTASGDPKVANLGARMWKIEAVFEMTTTAPVFTDEFGNSVAGVALTLADRLMWATDVPLSRFAFWMPNPAATTDATNVIFCESSNNEHRAGGWQSRYSTQENTTYACEPQKHKMNATTPVLLQRSSAAQKATSLSFEVGVYPASGIGGDTKPGVQVAEMVAKIANSGDEPERILHKTGLWTYKAGPGVKFHGLFPGTAAAMPGTAFSKRDTSLPLGPNPGGHGTEPTPTPPPGSAVVAEKSRQAYFDTVDTVVHEAATINTNVGNSLQELKDSLARGSAVHAAWMTWNPYTPDPALIGP